MRGVARRRFLQLAAAGAVGVAAGAGLLGRADRRWLEPDQELLRGFLTDFDGAAALGEQVDAGALGADPASVLAPAGAAPGEWFASLDHAAFAEHVRAAVADDHARGRLVPVGGWTLSRTEAALCALAARLSPRGRTSVGPGF